MLRRGQKQAWSHVGSPMQWHEHQSIGSSEKEWQCMENLARDKQNLTRSTLKEKDGDNVGDKNSRRFARNVCPLRIRRSRGIYESYSGEHWSDSGDDQNKKITFLLAGLMALHFWTLWCLFGMLPWGKLCFVVLTTILTVLPKPASISEQRDFVFTTGVEYPKIWRGTIRPTVTV